MTKLLGRKSRLVVETENCIWQKRKTRPIIVELKPDYMLIRIKGTRSLYVISYTSCLNQAIRNEIQRKQLEKARKAKANKPVKKVKR
jgi:hypothetical protein